MNCKCDKLTRLAPCQFYDGREIGLEGVDKVLSLSADVRTLGVESEGRDTRVNYSLTIKVIYLSEEGVVEIIQESQENHTLLRGCSLGKDGKVALKVTGVEHALQGKLKVRVLLEARCFRVDTTETTFIDGDGLRVREKERKLFTVAPFGGVEKAVSGVVKGLSTLGNVLSTDAIICLKKVSTATDICEIEGEIKIHVSELIGGELSSREMAITFSEDLLVEGVKESSEIELFLTPVSVSLTPSGEDESEVMVLLSVEGYVITPFEVLFPVDAYSKTSYTEFSYDEISLPEKGCYFECTERFNETLALDGIEDAVEIKWLGIPFIGASSFSAKDDAVVEGIICVELVVKRENGESERVVLEIPYSFKPNVDVDCTSDMDLTVEIADLVAKLRFGSSVEVVGEVKIKIVGNAESAVRYLKSVTFSGEREPNDAVISLYLVGKGETLFDCAKALVSDEEELLKLNPDLSLPLKEGDKVLLYRPL